MSSAVPGSGLYSNGQNKNGLHPHRTYSPEKETNSKPKRKKSLKLQILRSALKEKGCCNTE